MALKLQLIMFLLFLSVTLAAQTSPSSADHILKEAYQQAAKEQKNVLVIFHASWCGWCHKMDSSINDQSCKKFFDDNYVIRHLVVDESRDKKNHGEPPVIEWIVNPPLLAYQRREILLPKSTGSDSVEGYYDLPFRP